MDLSDALIRFILQDWKDIYNKYNISSAYELEEFINHPRVAPTNPVNVGDLTEAEHALLRYILARNIPNEVWNNIKDTPANQLTTDEIGRVRLMLNGDGQAISNEELTYLRMLMGDGFKAEHIAMIRDMYVSNLLDRFNTAERELPDYFIKTNNNTKAIETIIGCKNEIDRSISLNRSDDTSCLSLEEVHSLLRTFIEQRSNLGNMLKDYLNGEFVSDHVAKPTDDETWKKLSTVLAHTFYSDVEDMMTYPGTQYEPKVAAKFDDFRCYFNTVFIFDVYLTQLECSLVLLDATKSDSFPNTIDGLLETYFYLDTAATFKFTIEHTQIDKDGKTEDHMRFLITWVSGYGALEPIEWIHASYSVRRDWILERAAIVPRVQITREWVDKGEEGSGYVLCITGTLHYYDHAESDSLEILDHLEIVEMFKVYQPSFMQRETYKLDFDAFDIITSNNAVYYNQELHPGLLEKTNDIKNTDKFKDRFNVVNALTISRATNNAGRFILKTECINAAGPALLASNLVSGFDYKRQDNMIQMTKEQQLGLTDSVNKLANTALTYGASSIINGFEKVSTLEYNANLVSDAYYKFNLKNPADGGILLDFTKMDIKDEVTVKGGSLRLDDNLQQLFTNTQKQLYNIYKASYKTNDGNISSLLVYVGTDVVCGEPMYEEFQRHTIRFPDVTKSVSQSGNAASQIATFSVNRMAGESWCEYYYPVNIQNVVTWVFVGDPGWIIPPGASNSIECAIQIGGELTLIDNFVVTDFTDADSNKLHGLMGVVEHRPTTNNGVIRLRVNSTKQTSSSETKYEFLSGMTNGTNINRGNIPLAGGYATVGVKYKYECKAGPVGQNCGWFDNGVEESITYKFGGDLLNSVWFTSTRNTTPEDDKQVIYFDDVFTNYFNKKEMIVELRGNFNSPSKPIHFEGTKEWNQPIQGNSAAMRSLISTMSFLYKRLDSVEERLEVIFNTLNKGNDTIGKIEKFLNTASMVAFVVAPYVGAALGVSSTLLGIIDNGPSDASDWVNAVIAGATYAMLAMHQVYKGTPPEQIQENIKKQIKTIDEKLTKTTAIGRRIKGYFGVDSVHYAEWTAETGFSHQNIRERWRNAGLLEGNGIPLETIPKEIEVSQTEVQSIEASSDHFGKVEVISNRGNDHFSFQNNRNMEELRKADNDWIGKVRENPIMDTLRKYNVAPEHSYTRMTWRDHEAFDPDTNKGTYLENTLICGIGDFAVKDNYSRIPGSQPGLKYSYKIGKVNFCREVEYSVNDSGQQVVTNTKWSFDKSNMHEARVKQIVAKSCNYARKQGLIGIRDQVKITTDTILKQYEYLCDIYYTDYRYGETPTQHQVVAKVPIINVDARRFIAENIDNLPWNYSMYRNNCQHFVEGITTYLTTGRIPNFMAREKEVMNVLSKWMRDNAEALKLTTKWMTSMGLYYY